MNFFRPLNHYRLPLAIRLVLCVALASLACLASMALGLAQEPTPDLVAKIQEHYDRTRSIRADFTQETRSRAASLGTSAQGTVYFLKPRAIRWDYEKPQQRFVISDKNAWLYVPDENTVYLYQIDQILSSPIVLSFFSGLGQLSKTFRITQLPTEPGPPTQYRLELLPREAESAVSRVTLWIDAASYLVVRIQTEDPLGNLNQISFSNIQVGPPLEESWFSFEVPAGVRVERQEFSSK